MIESKILSSALEADMDYKNFKISEARGGLTDISTLQIAFCCAKSALIHEPIQLLDYLVLRLL
jgi:hypothetical protein